MGNYIVKRLIIAIPTLFIIVTLAFLMIRAAPGGPFDTDRGLHPQIEANLNEKYHLDEPLIQQYGRYLFSVLQGDLGPSFQYRDYTVNEIIMSGLSTSLQLGFSALVLALIIGVSFGAIAALKQNSFADYSIMSLSMTGISIPNFVIAPLLILFFAIYLRWLPAGGWGGGNFVNMILPTVSLALVQVAYIARITRGSMIEVLNSNFVRTAKAKGLPTHQIILRHTLKPALLPVVSYLGPAAVMLITGSIVIEQIYQVPGLGRHFIQAALNRDYTLVTGIAIFYGTLIIFFNLLVDILYAFLDPKVRYT